MEPRFPDITVQLTGRESDQGVVGKVCRALKDAGQEAHVNAFLLDADVSDHMVATTMEWVNVE